MEEIRVAPDLVILSFGFSISFLIGVVRNFFKEDMFQRITIYAVSFYLISFFTLQILFYISKGSYFETEIGNVMILNLLTIFLGFGLMATQGILPSLSHLASVVLLFLISGCLFPLFYFLLQFGFFAELKVVDQGKVSYLFLVSGSMVWFFELFLKSETDAEKDTKFYDGNFIFLLGLPLSLLVGFGNHLGSDVYPLFAKALLCFFAVLLGMFTVHRNPELNKGSIILALLASINFTNVFLHTSLLIQVPLCFVLGIFLLLAAEWLDKKDWSKNGTVLLVSTLLTGFIGIFLSLLVIPDSLWPHPPLVMLGVQALYLFSVFLISIFIASCVYFFPKQSGH